MRWLETEVRLITLSAIISYIFGSIPVGFIVARTVKKVDIRKLGSKNIGATNVFHIIGHFYGVITFLLDMIKPILAMYIASLVHLPEWSVPLIGASAVIGNLWSPFLKFKGGRGLSVTVGYFIYVMPRAVFLVFLIAFVVAFLTRWNLPAMGLSLYIVGPIIAARVYHYPGYVIKTTLYLGLFILIRQIPWMVIHLTNYYRRRKAPL
jgi:acyl-phosphate glycerol 3-phosphate acyltransferase